jgi:hypothetical protein
VYAGLGLPWETCGGLPMFTNVYHSNESEIRARFFADLIGNHHFVAGKMFCD